MSYDNDGKCTYMHILNSDMGFDCACMKYIIMIIRNRTERLLANTVWSGLTIEVLTWVTWISSIKLQSSIALKFYSFLFFVDRIFFIFLFKRDSSDNFVSKICSQSLSPSSPYTAVSLEWTDCIHHLPFHWGCKACPYFWPNNGYCICSIAKDW